MKLDDVNRLSRTMSEDPTDYRVGYRNPPLHTRFKKGQSGNPEGGRRHRSRHRRLAALLEDALDARTGRRRSGAGTRREAIVAALVEKSAAGDLRAVKLLLDLVEKTGLDREAEDEGDAVSARQHLIAELDRLAAAQEKAEAAARLTRDDSVCG